MSDNPITDTKMLAEANALSFEDKGNGHVQISGHGALVNYYPLSKRRTVYIQSTGESIKDCSPWDAVRACLTKSKAGMKPKKPTKNRPQVDLRPKRTNPAGIRHTYRGSKPPWEYDHFIMAASDRVRIEAFKLDFGA